MTKNFKWSLITGSDFGRSITASRRRANPITQFILRRIEHELSTIIQQLEQTISLRGGISRGDEDSPEPFPEIIKFPTTFGGRG